jgi:hypothetical protein
VIGGGDGSSPGRNLEELIASSESKDLELAAADHGLSEDLALKLLNHRELPGRALELLAKNPSAMKHRRVLTGIVTHPRTPRFVSLPIANRLFVFELMQIALSPRVATDVRVAADNSIIARLESVSVGERLALAKQGSTRLAGALLTDPEARTIEAALNNPRMTEVEIEKALKRDDAPQALISTVCEHQKWSLRSEIQVHVLQAAHTPFAKAILMAEKLPPAVVSDVLRNSRLPAHVRAYLLEMQVRRKG